MSERNDSRTYGFVMVSTLTHVALAAGVMAVNITSEHRQHEATQVEVLAEDLPAPESAPETTPEIVSEAPVQADEDRAAEAPKAVEPAMPARKQPLLVQKNLPPKSLPVANHPVRQSKPESAAPETPSQEESPVVLPLAENTESQTIPEEPVATLKDEDIAEDLQQVDEEGSSQLAAAQEELAKTSEEELKKQEAQLTALQKKNQEDSNRLAKERAEREENERQALAAAAADRMAVEAQADREAEQARQAEAARLAEEAKIAEKAKAQAIVAGNGSGGTGGEASEVRALSELKQMPGNQAPHYDAEDRLQKRQGEVAFLAYVSQGGSVSEFKMLQSSGHRALDAKTLKAIKSWKFYPGQEGWVEIPFKWDLKGGPQEMPTRLRLKSQASQN